MSFSKIILKYGYDWKLVIRKGKNVWVLPSIDLQYVTAVASTSEITASHLMAYEEQQRTFWEL